MAHPSMSNMQQQMPEKSASALKLGQDTEFSSSGISGSEFSDSTEGDVVSGAQVFSSDEDHPFTGAKAAGAAVRHSGRGQPVAKKQSCRRICLTAVIAVGAVLVILGAVGLVTGIVCAETHRHDASGTGGGNDPSSSTSSTTTASVTATKPVGPGTETTSTTRSATKTRTSTRSKTVTEVPGKCAQAHDEAVCDAFGGCHWSDTKISAVALRTAVDTPLVPLSSSGPVQPEALVKPEALLSSAGKCLQGGLPAPACSTYTTEQLCTLSHEDKDSKQFSCRWNKEDKQCSRHDKPKDTFPAWLGWTLGVVGFVAGIFGLTFLIKWLKSRNAASPNDNDDAAGSNDDGSAASPEQDGKAGSADGSVDDSKSINSDDSALNEELLAIMDRANVSDSVNANDGTLNEEELLAILDRDQIYEGDFNGAAHDEPSFFEKAKTFLQEKARTLFETVQNSMPWSQPAPEANPAGQDLNQDLLETLDFDQAHEGDFYGDVYDTVGQPHKLMDQSNPQDTTDLLQASLPNNQVEVGPDSFQHNNILDNIAHENPVVSAGSSVRPENFNGDLVHSPEPVGNHEPVHFE